MIDVVQSAIQEEVKRGGAMRREVAKAARGGDNNGEEEDGEIEMERAVSSSLSFCNLSSCLYSFSSYFFFFVILRLLY